MPSSPQDKLTLREDIHGIDAVKAYFQVCHWASDQRVPSCLLLSLPFMCTHCLGMCGTATPGCASWPQAYIDRYNFEHVPICGAVDEHAHCTFALHVDKVIFKKPRGPVRMHAINTCRVELLMSLHFGAQQVSPKSGHHQQQHASGDAKPSDTIGVFHLRFDRGDERCARHLLFAPAKPRRGAAQGATPLLCTEFAEM